LRTSSGSVDKQPTELSVDSRTIHYGEIQVVGASDSTACQVEKALAILSQPGFPKQQLVSHQLACRILPAPSR
jgi:L-iditol 2-dehydrogenase